MDRTNDLMGTLDAAAYLGISVSGLKYHIQQGHITPRVIGRTRLFTRPQLDTFKAQNRRPGRPKKPKD